MGGDGAKAQLAVLGKRHGRYGLRLHPDETRYLDFRPNRYGGRGKGATFDFLGFTHYWVRSRKGHPVVRRTTAKNRFARARRAANDWCRRHRYDEVPRRWEHLASVIRGHGNYYGLSEAPNRQCSLPDRNHTSNAEQRCFVYEQAKHRPPRRGQFPMERRQA